MMAPAPGLLLAFHQYLAKARKAKAKAKARKAKAKAKVRKAKAN